MYLTAGFSLYISTICRSCFLLEQASFKQRMDKAKTQFVALRHMIGIHLKKPGSNFIGHWLVWRYKAKGEILFLSKVKNMEYIFKVMNVMAKH